MKKESAQTFIETTELKAEQERTMRSINSQLGHMLTTDNEAEYFESAAELMKLLNLAYHQANFARDNKSKINYADQVLDYSLDTLQDSTLPSKKSFTFDN
jgi:hypothetical protein